jgi:MFS family permease
MNKNNISLLYFIILISFGSVGAVIPSGALVNISSAFGIAKHETDSIISLFLLGYAISQLMYAYIGNIIGSIGVIRWGAYLAIFGFFITAISYNINCLLLGRFISGVGSGCGLAVTFGLISYYYKTPNKAKQVTSYTSSAFAVMPGVAVFLGGIINNYLNWKYIWYFMLVYSLIILLIANQLSKTYELLPKAKIHLHNFYGELKTYGYPAIIWGICGGMIYMFASHLPVISMLEFKLNSLQFSFIYSLAMLGYFLGNIITAVFHKKYNSKIILNIGMLINFIAAISFVIIHVVQDYTLFYFAPIFFLYVSFPMIFSTLIAFAMQSVINKTVASAMSAFICMVLSALITSGVSVININAAVETYIILLLCVLLNVVTYYYMQIVKLK